MTPSIDQALHQFFTLLLILTLLPNLTFYLIARGFNRTFATGAAWQQRTLTPPDTWSCPALGLASVLMLRPISPELVLFLDFWVSNIPRYFFFCLLISIRSRSDALCGDLGLKFNRIHLDPIIFEYLIHHRCTCKWDCYEMLTVSFPLRAKAACIPLRMNTERRWREKGMRFVPIAKPNVYWETKMLAKTTKKIHQILDHLDDVICIVLVFIIRVLLHKICFFVS